MKVSFYPGAAMGMNIKDPEVHAMARELAARRSTSVTDAVRQALRAELARSPSPEMARSVEAKKAAVRAICARFSARPEWQGRPHRELQDALYDDQGLPK
jgi:antitoxin VapB